MVDAANSSAAGPGAKPLLSLRGLGIRAGERTLLADTDLDLHAGQRVVIVGPSGSGKSVLGNLLLGFVGPETPGLDIHGELIVDGQSLLDQPPEARDGRLGAVFQLHAIGLFDDFSVRRNLEYGSTDAGRIREVASSLGLSDLDARVTDCSGGQRMRVALARTLLRGAGILLYDEPTTGLDPASTRQVVEAIEASHDRLTLVVTHDYAAFEGFADVVLYLDAEAHRLELHPPVPATFDEVARRMAALTPPATIPAPKRAPLLKRVAGAWRRRADALAESLFDAAALLKLPLTWLKLASPLEGARLRRSLRRNLAPGVAVFIALSAALSAFTGTWFLFERLPKREFSEPLIREDLLAGLGLIFTRVGVPLMVCILLAAKLGASAAAHLGHMSYSRQVDALRLLRRSPRTDLLLPSATGILVSALVMTALAEVVAWFTAQLVFLWTHPGFSLRYFHAAWVSELESGSFVWLTAKVATSALAVALVAFRQGSTPKRDPEAVVVGIHRTLLQSLILVLTIHAIYAFLEF